MDECLGEKTQQLMFILRLTALFVEENRQMETKRILVDTQNYRMPQTNKKRWIPLTFLTQKIQLAHFRVRPYFKHHRKRVEFAHLQSKKRSPNPTVSTLWELVMFQVSFRTLFRNELSTKNARSSEMLKTNKGREFEAP